MEPKSTDDGMTKFENVSFSVLVKDDRDLAALRRDYASMPIQERRKAADWEYHSQMASEIFNDSMALAKVCHFSKGRSFYLFMWTTCLPASCFENDGLTYNQ